MERSYSTTLSASGRTVPTLEYCFRLLAGRVQPPAARIERQADERSSRFFQRYQKGLERLCPRQPLPPLLLPSLLPLVLRPPPPTTSGSSTLATAYAAYIAANYGSAQGYTSANTYYVSPHGSDSYSGTADSPWATFAQADGATPACSLILFESEQYSTGLINSNSSGTSTAIKPSPRRAT